MPRRSNSSDPIDPYSVRVNLSLFVAVLVVFAVGVGLIIKGLST
jgi:hypothetical protein